MQMIDVLKRIAELDAQNPNIVKEDSQLDECGMMPEMGMPAVPHMPPPPPANLSLNATAATGEEVANMLSQIMTLAGVHKVEPHHLGIDSEPEALTAEPSQSAGDTMRSVIDKLNPDDSDEPSDSDDGDKEEVDEYDNNGADPTDKNEFDPNQFAHQENQPGQGDRMDGNMPKAFAKTMEDIEKNLITDYRNFLKEIE